MQLFCHECVIEKLLALPARPWEIGGWLLGYWACEDTITVTHATPPGPRGTPFGVRIGARRHRPLFDAAWDASGGKVTFLGDWHTHPGGPPSPSARDRRALAFLAGDADFGTPRPMAGIVQLPRWPRSRERRTIRFWIRDSEGAVDELKPELFDALPDAAKDVPDWEWPIGKATAGSTRR